VYVKTVNTHEAKTQLSRLLKRVALGEQITIARRGKAVARLVPVPEKESGRKLGMFQGKFVVPDDFDAPLPEEILDAFEGKLKRTRKRA
jgi:prevent-host-death family protein